MCSHCRGIETDCVHNFTLPSYAVRVFRFTAQQGRTYMMVEKLKCLFGSHTPVRHDVKWTGRSHIGTCRYCGRDIRRISGGKWRRTRER